jgi:Uncharacterized conserved protein
MNKWFVQADERKLAIITQTANLVGLPPQAVEKDLWVTLTLRALFQLPVSDHMVFKGGTSLSKAWKQIERFSEDIDLAIDRVYFGFKGNLSKNQLDKLRRASCEYVTKEFKIQLENKLRSMGAKPDKFSLIAREVKNTDTDPQTLELQYQPLVGSKSYLPDRVLIEVGSRSLIEPHTPRSIQSLIDEEYPQQEFTSLPFQVPSVVPERTFLEKIMLLHEEFLKTPEKTRPNRMSRHLYDLHRLMDTNYGINAIKDKTLFDTIVSHRRKFTPVRGLNYSLHTPQTINLIPPENIIREWEADYKVMQTNMIYGDAPSFNELTKRMNILMDRLKKQDKES